MQSPAAVRPGPLSMPRQYRWPVGRRRPVPSSCRECASRAHGRECLARTLRPATARRDPSRATDRTRRNLRGPAVWPATRRGAKAPAGPPGSSRQSLRRAQCPARRDPLPRHRKRVDRLNRGPARVRQIQRAMATRLRHNRSGESRGRRHEFRPDRVLDRFGQYRIDRAQRCAVQRPVKKPVQRIHLIGFSPAPDRDGHTHFEYPADAEVEQRTAEAIAGIFLKAFDGAQILAIAGLGELGVVVAQVVALERCIEGHLSGQQAAAERTVGHQRDLIAVAVRLDRRLDAALEYVVRRLAYIYRALGPKTLHLIAGEVAHADVADQILVEQAAHRARGFFDGTGRIRPVNMVDVDSIAAQALQRVFDLAFDTVRRAVPVDTAVVVPFQADLGRYMYLIAAVMLGERLADNFFGRPEAVDRRGIDQRHALVDCRMDRVYRSTLFGAAPHPAADGPGTQRNARDLEIGSRNSDRLHRCSSFIEFRFQAQGPCRTRPRRSPGRDRRARIHREATDSPRWWRGCRCRTWQ